MRRSFASYVGSVSYHILNRERTPCVGRRVEETYWSHSKSEVPPPRFVLHRTMQSFARRRNDSVESRFSATCRDLGAMRSDLGGKWKLSVFSCQWSAEALAEN